MVMNQLTHIYHNYKVPNLKKLFASQGQERNHIHICYQKLRSEDQLCNNLSLGQRLCICINKFLEDGIMPLKYTKYCTQHSICINSSCCCLVTKSCPTLQTPWIVVHQVPLSMGFPRQEYSSGLLFICPGDLHNPVKPASLVSPALQADSLSLSHLGSLYFY